MTDHLPECVASVVRMGYDDAYCICPDLRACEGRVEESMDRAWEKFSRDQFDAGYAAAIEDMKKEQ